MENENKKIGFLSRVKIAVTKPENYSIFLEEKTSVAVKYFFLIVLILVVCMGIVETYSIMKVVGKGYEYIQSELPDFSYENGNLQFSEVVNAYDEEFDLYMIADTSDDVPNEKMQEYKDMIKSNGVIFLKDKVTYKSGTDEVEYKYSDLTNRYGMKKLDKTQLIEEINDVGLIGIAVTIFMVIVFGLYIIQAISIFMDWFVIAIFAFLSARICRINLNFKNAFNISIYALTLSIILTILYNIAYYLTGFYTEYFRIVYLLISYVYIVAAILMIKSDLMKQQVEVSKVVDVQNKMHDELNNPENKDEEDKKENKMPENENDKRKDESDNDEVDGEPDGSEI